MALRTSAFSLLLTALVIASAAQAAASDFTLDFGGLQDHEEVLSYYDGGFGSLGSGPGPDFNLTFTSSFLAIEATPPYGPPRVGLLDGPTATMNSSDGFSGFFSFYYEATDNSGLVTLWSGLDGTGSLLLSVPLDQADDWTPAGGGFGGTAMSVVFTGTADALRFDQITDRGAVIPEPSTILLMGTGLASLATLLRRRIR
jgi:hypothetical protein